MGGLLLFYFLSVARIHVARDRLYSHRHAHPVGSFVSFKGTVVSLPWGKGGSYRVLLAGPFLVELHGRGEAPHPGDLVLVRGRVMSVRGFRNPGGMDREAWYTRQGVVFPLYVRDWELLKAGALPFYRQFPLDFAAWGVSRLRRDLGEEAGAVVSSLVLGFRQGMGWETKNLFTSTGLGHLLAVSGFHMGVVFLFLYTIARLILKTGALLYPPPSMAWLPSRLALVPALLFLLFYLLVTGTPPSALRAFVMIACWVVARFAGRDRSLEGALVLAFFLMTLANPMVIFKVGFQLTFAAMLGVVAVLWLVEPLDGWRAEIGGYVAMAFLVPLFTLPFILYHFHRFSPYAPLANLLFIVPAGLLVVLGLLHLLLFPLPFFQGWVVFLERVLISFLLKGLGFMASLPRASVWVTRMEAVFLSLLVVLGLASFFLVRRGKKWAFLLPFLALCVFFVPRPRGILLMDLGKRGGALLFQGEKEILVDAGLVRGRGGWASLRDALLWRDAIELDALVVSRIIPSRASLVPRVLENFKVKRLYLPVKAERKDLEVSILRVARAKEAEVVRVGEPLSVGPFSLVPRGKARLEVEIKPLILRETSKGWLWKGKLLKPWQRGAMEISGPDRGTNRR